MEWIIHSPLELQTPRQPCWLTWQCHFGQSCSYPHTEKSSLVKSKQSFLKIMNFCIWLTKQQRALLWLQDHVSICWRWTLTALTPPASWNHCPGLLVPLGVYGNQINLMCHLRSGKWWKKELGFPQHHCKGHREFSVESKTACQKQVLCQTQGKPMMASAK